MTDLRLGVIGGGAIAQGTYLPILRDKRGVELTAIVDLDDKLAARLKSEFGAKEHARNYREILHSVDAAIICLPNFLHGPVAKDFLRCKVNVLCEKPLALSSSDVNEMIAVADQEEVLLYPAHIRRFYWSSKEVKKILRTGLLGDLRSIEAEEGEVFDWPTLSGFFFDKMKSGGGVLIDMGSHVLDLLLWWLDMYPLETFYADDDYGGVEADAKLDMMFDGNIGVSVQLSRLRNLQNRIRLEFTEGTVTYRTEDFNRITVESKVGKISSMSSDCAISFEKYFEAMIDDFLLCVRESKRPTVDPTEVLHSIRLIQHCYAHPRHLDLPWM
jgi:predicted dehydrogenase